jgi:ethanolamine-phosphate cytidylyltransferase
MGAPYEVTKELIERFNVHIVAQGRTSLQETACGDADPFAVPKRMGIYRLVSVSIVRCLCKNELIANLQVDSGNDMTTSMIIDRIISNRLQFESRNKAKECKERAAFDALQNLKANGGSTADVVSIDAQVSSRDDLSRFENTGI